MAREKPSMAKICIFTSEERGYPNEKEKKNAPHHIRKGMQSIGL